jgi:hypothetical protein
MRHSVIADYCDNAPSNARHAYLVSLTGLDET